MWKLSHFNVLYYLSQQLHGKSTLAHGNKLQHHRDRGPQSVVSSPSSVRTSGGFVAITANGDVVNLPDGENRDGHYEKNGRNYVNVNNNCHLNDAGEHFKPYFYILKKNIWKVWFKTYCLEHGYWML